MSASQQGISHKPNSLSSPETEQALLGAILLDGACLEDVADMVKPDDMSVGRHKVIYQACLDLDREFKPCDLVTVVEKLKSTGNLDKAGGVTYVASLSTSVPSAGRATVYAQTLRDLSLRRGLVNAARQIAATAQDAEIDLEDALSRSEEVLFGVTQRETEDEPQRLLYLVVERVEHLYETRGKAEEDFVPTGFAGLDDMIAGLMPGTLNIVAGRAGMGKTSFGFQLCLQAAEKGKTVLFVSLEMSADQLSDRVIVQKTGIDMTALKKRHLSSEQWARARAEAQKLAGLPLYVDTAQGLTSERAVSRARRFKAKHGKLDLIAVDYLTHLSDRATRGESRNNLVGDMARRFKDAAKELNCPVILLSQLNREADRDKGANRPHMGQLRDSGEIEAHADLVLLVYRPEYYLPNDASVKGIVEIIVGKNRQGPVGTVVLNFDAARTQFGPRRA